MNQDIKEKRIQDIEYFPHYLFEQKNKYYVYSSLSNRIFHLDEVAYEFVKHQRKTDDSYDYDGMVDLLEQAFIIKTDKSEESLNKLYDQAESRNKPSFIEATLMISQACNLRCVYCYGEGGEYKHKGFMDFDIAKKTIDWLLANNPKDKPIYIIFFGGEPLLSFDLIKKIVEYGNKRMKEENRKIGYSMTTNGTLITDEIEKYLLDNNIVTQISMDGKKEVQDTNRYYANHNGSYDVVMAHTKSLREKKLLNVRATISPTNMELKENLKHLVDMSFNKVSWATANNLMSDENFKNYENSFDLLIDYIEELIQMGEYKEVKKYTMVMDFLYKLNKPKPKTQQCGSGKTMMAVNIDGDIFPCHRFVGIDKYKLGNINDLNLDVVNKHELYNQLSIRRFSDCSNCIIEGLCAGACINDNYYDNGAINKTRTAQCEYIKKVSMRMIHIYVNLTEAQKKGLFDSDK